MMGFLVFNHHSLPFDVSGESATVRNTTSLFLEHREIYGKARLLLADEVGVGKTLSMATSALVSALLEDGQILILTPSTLMIQWQIEMMDKLGIPTAVWSSQKKVWLGVEGQILSPRGDASSIKKCPSKHLILGTATPIQTDVRKPENLSFKTIP